MLTNVSMSAHNLAIVCSSHTPDWCYENTDTSSAVMMLCVMKTLHCHCHGYIHLLGQMLGPAIMERGRQDINNSVMFCNCSVDQLPKDGNWEMRVWVQQKMLHNKSDITCWTNIYCILSTRLLALAGPGLQLGGAQAAAVLTVGRVRAGGQSNRHPRAIKEAVNLCKIVKYAFSGNLVIINLIFS